MNISVCHYNVTQPVPFFSLLCNGPLTTFCAIVGCIGNSFSINTLTTKIHIGKVLRNYLICLALWDSAVLFCVFCYYGLYNSMIYVTGHYFEQTGFWAYLAVIFHGPLSVAFTGSTWTTVAIAFARYFVVLCPLRTVAVRTFVKSIYLNTSLFICAILYCIPCFFELKLETCIEHTNHGQTIITHAWPWLLTNNIYQVLYRTVSFSLFVSIGPFIAILIMSVHTIYLLSKRNKRHTAQNIKMGRGNKSHWRNAILFSIILGKFLLCYSVPTILMLLFNFVGSKLFRHEVIIIIADIGNFLFVFNSATNFFIYMIWQKYSTTKRKNHTVTAEMEMNSITCNASNLQLTALESEMLFQSWQDAKRCHGRKLFHRLVKFLLEEQDNVDEMLDVQAMASQTDNMMAFFNKIVSEIHTDPTHKLPCSYIQHVGRSHHQRNIKLTNDIFSNFKTTLMEEVANRRSSQAIVGLSNVANANVESTELRIWFRLLNGIIAELKLGYMATPSITASPRLNLTESEDNPRSPLLLKSKRIRTRKFTV